MSQHSENAYTWLREAIRHYNAKRYQECVDASERAIQLDPEYARAYHGKGLALARLKRYEEALRTYQEATRLAPEDAKLHANVAGLLFYKGEYEQSGVAYRRAIQLDTQFEPVYAEKSKMLLNKAFTFLILDRHSSAIRFFYKILLFNPNDATTSAEIGKIQKEKGLVLAEYGWRGKVIEEYLEASYIIPEEAKFHVNVAVELYYRGEYEQSGLSYKRAIQFDSHLETIYAEKSKMLLDKAFTCLNTYLPNLNRREFAISAFREVLLFNPDNTAALAEIGKIQKEIQEEEERLKKCSTPYNGTLVYTDKDTKCATINVCSKQSDEEVRINFLKGMTGSNYFSKTADGWGISFSFSSQEISFRVEVLHNGTVIAYGSYWIKYGYLIRRDAEDNIYITFANKPVGKSSEEQRGDQPNRSIIYVPNRSGGRNRRVRRGS